MITLDTQISFLSLYGASYFELRRPKIVIQTKLIAALLARYFQHLVRSVEQ